MCREFQSRFLRSLVLDAVSDLPTTPSVIVRSGTSRFVVVLRNAALEAAGLERTLLNLMIGETPADGLAGDHYQMNKVVVMPCSSDAHYLPFQFYQVDRAQQILIPEMECANAAAAAGAFCLYTGLREPDARGVIRLCNMGTARKVEVSPETPSSFWSSDWRIRFLFDDVVVPVVSSSFIHDYGGAKRDCHLISEGNFFVLVNTPPAEVDSGFLTALTERVQNEATAMGKSPMLTANAKIVTYSKEVRGANGYSLEARCFYRGQVHHSIPGSAAICLARVLAPSLVKQNLTPAAFGTSRLAIVHPSGDSHLDIHWSQTNGGVHVQSVSFVSGVRLLLTGSVVLPTPRRAPGIVSTPKSYLETGRRLA